MTALSGEPWRRFYMSRRKATNGIKLVEVVKICSAGNLVGTPAGPIFI